MKTRDTWVRRRVFIVLGLFVFLFGVVFARAFKMQVMDRDFLKEMADSQHTALIKVQPKRGGIYDRNLKELAVSLETYSIYARPHMLDSPRKAARELAALLGERPGEIEKRLSTDKRFVWVKRQAELTEDDRRKLDGLKWAGAVKEPKRFYPNMELASNMVGFTDIDSNGIEGVELARDAYLKGVSYETTGERDAKGKILLYEDINRTASIEGLDVVLTIDKNIQHIVERELAAAIELAEAKGATAVVMDPATGEVLAMATLPNFNPNERAGLSSQRWKNRAITDEFEPGSTFKTFLLAAALEEGVVGPEDLFYCENGSYKVRDRVFHDVKKHEWLTVAQVLKLSSNIGAAKIGEKLGKESYYRYLKRFGFGSRTGIDLPGEADGSLRHFRDWSSVTVDTISFGQGVSVTAVQLAQAMSAIANRGYLMRPFVVRSVVDKAGRPLFETSPVIIRRAVSEETAGEVARMLEAAAGTGGTGEKAGLKGFAVAGKTGTAQKPDFKNGGYLKGRYVASFLGFVPADAPRFVIFVAIDEPKQELYSGGLIAAPVFRGIAEKIFSYMGVFPEAAPDLRPETPRIVEAGLGRERDIAQRFLGEDIAPDLSGMTMREVVMAAARTSIDVKMEGSGRAVSQRPSPGEPLRHGAMLEVVFE